MSESETRMVLALMVVFTATIMFHTTVLAHILSSLVADRMEFMTAQLLIWAMGVADLILSSVGFAVTRNGYARAFWQLFGCDLTPDDEPGESV